MSGCHHWQRSDPRGADSSSKKDGSLTTSTPGQAQSGGLEVRSIDYVPLDERHGKVSSIGPLWFMSNAQIATPAVGLIGITTGGNLIWSLIAIAIGVLVGTLFIAAHSSQGPQLGLPQMIQSRPQFGYVGALLVWLFAYLQYAGFNIFNTVLAGPAIAGSVHVGSDNLWFWVVTVGRRRRRPVRLRPDPPFRALPDLSHHRDAGPTDHSGTH